MDFISLQMSSEIQAVPRMYLSGSLALAEAGRGGGGVVRAEEWFLWGQHGDLILPVQPVVTQLTDPFIKQLLRLDL